MCIRTKSVIFNKMYSFPFLRIKKKNKKTLASHILYEIFTIYSVQLFNFSDERIRIK